MQIAYLPLLSAWWWRGVGELRHAPQPSCLCADGSPLLSESATTSRGPAGSRRSYCQKYW
ncbi:unnamed protein product [Dibothriocephalus latus]|uniref:Uncharacterized protein n=1 Tax=Dibothriocephalus latus TaxID=60516 RepID=A0A3P6QAD1_DIBLA|nr:unnamed protein product [Dibothriocephalus latus]